MSALPPAPKWGRSDGREYDEFLRRVKDAIATMAPAAGYAPVTSSFVTAAAEALLTASRRLLGSAGRVTLTDAGAGATLTIDLATGIVTAGTTAYPTSITVDA